MTSPAAIRIRSAAIAIPMVVLLICFLPRVAFTACVSAVIILALRECTRMVGWQGLVEAWAVPVFGGVCLLATEWHREDGGGGLVTIGWIATGLLAVVLGSLAVLGRPPSRDVVTTKAGTMTLLFFYCVAGGVLATEVREQMDWGIWLLVLLFIVWAVDSGAYACGNWLGRYKMIPSVSPGKTWEGTVGGAVLGMAAGVACHLVFNWLDSLAMALLVTALLVLAAVFGDLIVSVIKRTWNVKDSGEFLPGHGGILDRIDSLLGALPVAAFIVFLG